MKIAISGASGLIGHRLLKTLPQDGHGVTAFSRHAGTNLPAGVRLAVWDPGKGPAPADSLKDTDAVIHLAGAPVAQRWNTKVKQEILDSRVVGTRNLVEGLSRLERRPQVLVCASAVGYYGSRGDEVLTEASGPGHDFLADVCVAWEREAQAAEALGVRVVRIRIGLVLDARGGALGQMLTAVQAGGGRQARRWTALDVLDSSGRPGRNGEVCAVQPGQRADERSGAESG